VAKGSGALGGGLGAGAVLAWADGDAGRAGGKQSGGGGGGSSGGGGGGGSGGSGVSRLVDSGAVGTLGDQTATGAPSSSSSSAAGSGRRTSTGGAEGGVDVFRLQLKALQALVATTASLIRWDVHWCALVGGHLHEHLKRGGKEVDGVGTCVMVR